MGVLEVLPQASECFGNATNVTEDVGVKFFFEKWQVAHQDNVRFLFPMMIPQIFYVHTLQTHL